MTDQVWVAVEKAVRAGLTDASVLQTPPRTDEDLMWLAATVTDNVVSSLPPSVHRAFKAAVNH